MPVEFEKNTLILSGVGVDENPMHVDLNWCDFFVHVHDLPLSKISVEIAALIENKIGRFRDIETAESRRTWGATMTIRVPLNVSQPLFRALRICTTSGEELVVSFTYERLQNFCYLCGMPGHVSNFCEERFVEGFVGREMTCHTALGCVLLRVPGVQTPGESPSRLGRDIEALNDTDHPIRNTDGGSAADASQSASNHTVPLNRDVYTRPQDHSSRANDESHVPEMGMVARDDQEHNLAASSSIQQKTLPLHQAQSAGPCLGLESDMVIDDGLVTIPIQFTAVADGVREAKCRHLLDEESDVLTTSQDIMKLLVWNCQGLGSPWIVRVLSELIRFHNPGLVFLFETKCKRRKCDNLKEKFNLFGINVDSHGRAGGLILLWRKDINLEGLPTSGPRVRGSKFNWSNRREDSANVCVRLDRTCALLEWKLRFPYVIVQIERARGFDHSPLLVMLDGSPTAAAKSKKLFRFEAMWTYDARCKDTICSAWKPLTEGSAGDHLTHNTRYIRQELTDWDKVTFRNVNKQIKELEELLSLDANLNSIPIASRRAALRGKLDKCLTREEIMWKQLGKAQWLREGDLNIAFFHTRASTRRRKNTSSRLKLGDGSWSQTTEQVQHTILDYFGNLFASSLPLDEDIEMAIGGILAKVSAEMNRLIQPYSADEVQLALSQMLKPILASIMSESQSAFFLATPEAMHCIKRILRTLEAAFGLKINLEKSSVAYSKNVPLEGRDALAQSWVSVW
ncbi:UNVERIFIED_CONTAM: hypothetical protein Slati_1373000 [Sesamum latifolium]|uniref:CCHC-type domain-containing protein n=1 Tax=Sesamum latifolium TaxID=2727402 RepID=A0AAW2XIN8_9LAMI